MLSLNLNIVYTIINVLILFFVFKKFLFKPVDNILNARAEEIAKTEADAAKKLQDADAAKAKYEDSVKQVELEKEKILSDTREKANEEYNNIISKARSDSEAMVEKAKKDAAIEADRQKKAYEAELTDMVVDAASRIAAGSHSEAMDLELYDRFISEAGNTSEVQGAVSEES